MHNKGKNGRNQFIGRRTGKSVLPQEKDLRKREDGLEVFEDYWTDSEEENTCLIAEKRVAESQVSSTVPEEIDDNKGKVKASPVKTVVTDTIEIEAKEVVFNSSNHTMEKKNFSQKITIQCINEDQDDLLSPDSSSPHDINNSVITPSLEIHQCDSGIFPSGNSTEKSANDKSVTPSKRTLTPKKAMSASRHTNSESIIKEISFNLEHQDDADIHTSLNSSTLSTGQRKKRKAESDISSESKESDKSSDAKENKNNLRKASKKTSKRTKSSKSNHNNNVLSKNSENDQALDAIYEDEEFSNAGPKKIRLSVQSNITNILPGEKKKGKSKRSENQVSKGKENENNLEMNVTGARRSSRQRHAPLKFWSNERLQYRYTETGEVQCLGIVRDSKGDFLNYEKLFPKKKKPVVEKHIKPRKPVQPAKSFVEKGILVIDPESKEDVYANIVMPFDAIEWRSPKGQPLGKSFEVGKSYMLDKAAFGFLRLAPNQTKPMQYLPGYDAIFVVMEGKVEVCVNRTSVILNEKDTFYVPTGNGYSVTNLLNSTALLNFMATHDSYLNELKKSE